MSLQLMNSNKFLENITQFSANNEGNRNSYQRQAPHIFNDEKPFLSCACLDSFLIFAWKSLKLY